MRGWHDTQFSDLVPVHPQEILKTIPRSRSRRLRFFRRITSVDMSRSIVATIANFEWSCNFIRPIYIKLMIYKMEYIVHGFRYRMKL